MSAAKSVERCHGISSSNIRCKRKVKKGEQFCWQHKKHPLVPTQHNSGNRGSQKGKKIKLTSKTTKSKKKTSTKNKISKGNGKNPGKVYIQWNMKKDDYIIGIYRNKKLVSKECDDIEETDGTLMEGSSLIRKEDLMMCSSYYTDANRIYFLEIHESGGGGSYHEIGWLYASDDKEPLIERAIDYFSEEHNRDDECEDCQCEKKLIKDLRQEKKGIATADIECSSYEGASVKIWSVDVTP